MELLKAYNQETINQIAEKLLNQLKTRDNAGVLVGLENYKGVDHYVQCIGLEQIKGYFEVSSDVRCIRFDSLNDLHACIEKCL